MGTKGGMCSLNARGAGFHITQNAVHECASFVRIGAGFAVAIHVDAHGRIAQCCKLLDATFNVIVQSPPLVHDHDAWFRAGIRVVCDDAVHGGSAAFIN